jgi:hypothetical protein
MRAFRDFGNIIDDFGPMVCLLGALAFIVNVAFLATLDRTIKRVEPENRRIDTGMVWLNLIPVFNLLWMIVTIERVGESIRSEFVARGRHRFQESYGKTAGLAAAFLTGTGLLFGIGAAPCALILWFFAFIYWVVYWAQIAGYGHRLSKESARYSPPPDEGW